jgi:hypothetical protein
LTREERTLFNWQQNHRINENEKVERQCSQCKEWKVEETNFYLRNKSKPENGYQAECKDCSEFRSLKRYKTHIEEHNESNRKLRKKPEYQQKERERLKKCRERGLQQDWRIRNPDKVAIYNRNRIEHKKHDITTSQWISCKEFFDNKCAYCGLPIEEHFRPYRGQLQKIDLHKEHVIFNGENDITNCVPSCQSCNSSKWEYQLDEWYNDSNPNYTIERYNKIKEWMEIECKKYII